MKTSVLLIGLFLVLPIAGCGNASDGGSEEACVTDAAVQPGFTSATCPAKCAEPAECHFVTCENEACGTSAKIDGAECALPNGEAGYCLAGTCAVCNGCDDGNECTLDACTATGCAHYPYAVQQACAAGHCVINSFVSPDAALCVADGMCLDQDPISKVVAPVKVCSGGKKCGVYSGMCGSI